MSSYASTFATAVGRTHQQQRQFLSFTARQDCKVQKIRSQLDKKIQWFLDHGDWQQALKVIMLNLTNRTNRLIESRSSHSVVVPEHFGKLLQFDSRGSAAAAASSSSSASSPTALAYFIRDQALSDEIPNSPALYAELIDNFCRTHARPDTALDVALEGSARWRFSPDEKRKMGMSILRQCASQKNCWKTACDAMQSLINAGASCSDKNSLSPSPLSKHFHHHHHHHQPLSAAADETCSIRELLGKAALHSGLWRSVMSAVDSPPLHSSGTATNIVDPKDNSNDSSSDVPATNSDSSSRPSLDVSILWKAVSAASREREWEKALILFDQAVSLKSQSSSSVSGRSALHELVNVVGSQRKWKLCSELANKWIVEELRLSNATTAPIIDSVMSNLVFSSFPSPFLQQDDEERIVRAGARVIGAADGAVDAFRHASELFDKWMSDVDDYVPPPLTCALIVGFWSRLAKAQPEMHDDEFSWVENAISLLSRFTINEQTQSVLLDESIDEPTFHALHAARTIIINAVKSSSHQRQSKSLSCAVENESLFLRFPSPGYDKVLHHKQLFAHRAERWKQRFAAQSATGARSWFSRPGRQDYFPAFGKSSMLGLSDIVDDQGDLERAMEAARYAGQNSFELVDASSPRSSFADGVYRSAPAANSTPSNATPSPSSPLFNDPRPGPFGSNERLNGWNYYGMGGNTIYPGNKRSKVASPQHSILPRRMPGLFNPRRTWATSSPRYQCKTVAQNYRWGQSV